MAKTYVTDLRHFLDESGELKKMPAPARKMADFLVVVIDAATQVSSGRDQDTGVHCLRRDCKGSIRSSLDTGGQEIAWHCPECGKNGTIRKWEGTKWDPRGQAGKRTAAKSTAATSSSPAVAKYTPLEGQYLAFIHYYTKIHRCSPAEFDMQTYFQASPPTVHQMIVKLTERGFIEREPGKPRSIKLLLGRSDLPDLE